jgi:hypothetical protein
VGVRNEVPGYINLDALQHVQPGERVMSESEIELYVGPIYNAAGLTEDSSQGERRAVFIDALRKAIGDGSTITPRAHSEFGWVLATVYDPPASCRPVLRGSAEDLSRST